jgi:hypothetical protein
MREKFIEKFAHQLGGGHRFEPFQFIVTELSELNRPLLIVETGTARERGNWQGDGQSTLIWDWLIGEVGGQAQSVDFNQDAVEIARSQAPRVTCVWGDSQAFLRGFFEAELIDLLYLDAYDWGDSRQANSLSELHHVGELAAIYERLRSGCLIAVDDCHGIDQGKHVLVQEFFNRIGIEPLRRGYVTVWKKP